MDCELSIIPDKNIVISRFTGSITTEDRYRNRQRTLDFCRANKIKKVIVDTRGQISQSNSMEIFKFAQEMETEVEGYKIAFVQDRDSEHIKLIELIATNRDCNCKSFLDIKEAQQWLEQTT